MFYLFIYWPHCTECGVLFPRPEIEPILPAVDAQSFNHWTTWGVQFFFFNQTIQHEFCGNTVNVISLRLFFCVKKQWGG